MGIVKQKIINTIILSFFGLGTTKKDSVWFFHHLRIFVRSFIISFLFLQVNRPPHLINFRIILDLSVSLKTLYSLILI